MSASWAIELAVGSGDTPRPVALESLPVTFGRGGEADCTLDDHRVSRLHARLEESTRGLLLVDLDSANGTFVDGERVQQVVLAQGDAFVLGDTEVRLVKVARRTDPPADLIDKGLELGQELGEGLSCRVFEAHQRAMNRDVAVRFLLDVHAGHAGITRRFKDRLREQSRVSHASLASVIDFGEVRGLPYAVVERLPGRPLAEHLLAGWRPAPSDVPALLGQVLELLDHLHGQGRYLGQLDAEGLMLDDEGQLRVTAVGRPLPDLEETPDAHRDALTWLPPEAVAGGPADVAGDLFLVGALGRCLLARRPLRSAASSAAMLEGVRGTSLGTVEAPAGTPDALLTLLEDLTDPVPAARPVTAREVLEVLEPMLQAAPPVLAPAAVGGAVSEEPLPAAGRPVRSAAAQKRLKRISWTITGVLMIVLNGALFFWLRGNDDTLREFLGGEGQDASAAPDLGGEDATGAPHAGVGNSGETPTPSAADPLEESARRWRGVSARLTPLLQERRFDQACRLLREYIKSYSDGSHAGRARERLAAVEDSWRAEVLPHMAALERAIDDADPVAGHAALQRAVKAGAGQTHKERLATLREELRDLVARSAAPPAAGSGGTDAPGSHGSGPPGKPAPAVSATLPKALSAALQAPGDQAARNAVLERLGEPEAEVDAGDRRLLEGQERLFTALLKTLPQAAGKPLELTLAADRRLSGALLRVDATALVLKIGDQERSMPWKELPLGAWPALLERLPGDLDRYLVSGWIRCRTDAPVDAWFDLQAALILATGDPAASQEARELLADLGKRHGRPR